MNHGKPDLTVDPKRFRFSQNGKLLIAFFDSSQLRAAGDRKWLWLKDEKPSGEKRVQVGAKKKGCPQFLPRARRRFASLTANCYFATANPSAGGSV